MLIKYIRKFFKIVFSDSVIKKKKLRYNFDEIENCIKG